MDSAAAALIDGAMWNPLPAFDDHIDIGPPAPQNVHQNALGLFGGRTGPECIPQDQRLGTSFDALMRGLEQQPYTEVFSYKPAYEPLNWSLPSVDSWPDMTSSSSAPIASPRPFRADVSCETIRSLDSFSYPINSFHQPNKPSTFRSRSSSIRYDPLSAQRNTASRSMSTSTSANQGHQHQCSACPCKFARARDLTRHFRLHTGERPYECAGCHERFIRVDARKRHWNSHPACQAAHQNLHI